MLELVIMGPPGSGKGTQARKVAEHFSIIHVSTGDLLRDEIGSGSEVGKEAGGYIEKGELVPDALVKGLLERTLSSEKAEKGFILDGFPRNLNQVKMLDEVLKGSGKSIDAVLSLILADNVIIERLTGRRTCMNCHKMYHVDYSPPAKVGVCDDCGNELEIRKDDRKEVIQERLERFRRQTTPVAEHYRALGKYQEIDASDDEAEVFRRILDCLQKQST